MTDVRVPTLGESVTEATVATWFKQPGDSINMDEMLCELETDKVTVEVPSPAAGVMGSIVAQEGSVVSMDALLTTISEGSLEKLENEKKIQPDFFGIAHFFGGDLFGAATFGGAMVSGVPRWYVKN